MTADSYWTVIRDIDRVLTPEEQAAIVERFCAANPRWLGGRFDDILEALIDRDAYVAQTDWFFDAHEVTLPESPGGTKLYAAYAILAAGRDLTLESLTELLTRAGLTTPH